MKPIFRLAHAQAGEHYKTAIATLNQEMGSVTFLDIKLPDGLPLTANLAEGTLSGTVSDPGEYEISFVFFKQNTKPPKEELGTATLLILPNPKLMWKNIPSSKSCVYWAPDEKCSSTTTAGFVITAASKRGRSHAHVGSCRDDDYALASNGTWLACVVADGAGSAKYSRKGAQLACNLISASIIEQLNNAPDLGSTPTIDTDSIQIELAKVVQKSLQVAINAIQAECANLEAHCELREFSTTTLISIQRRYRDCCLIAGYSIGDGAMCIYQRSDAKVQLLSCPDSGEYAGQTRFLDSSAATKEVALRRTRVEVVPGFPALLMMSDGVSDPYFETESQLSDSKCWNALWESLEQSGSTRLSQPDTNLLQWLDFWSKGNHDDRTIIIITLE